MTINNVTYCFVGGKATLEEELKSTVQGSSMLPTTAPSALTQIAGAVSTDMRNSGNTTGSEVPLSNNSVSLTQATTGNAFEGSNITLSPGFYKLRCTCAANVFREVRIRIAGMSSCALNR